MYKSALNIALCLAASLLLPVQALAQSPPFPGASGLLYVPAQGCYICAQDVKGPSPTGHFGLLSFDAMNRPVYTALEADWGGMEPGNDIEALAAIPGRPDEFIACESGYWMGKYGRLWRLRLDWPAPTFSPAPSVPGGEPGGGPAVPAGPQPLVPAVSALSFVQLPQFGDEVEGVALMARDNDFLVIFGLRGGATPYSSGWLRWGWLDFSDGTVSMYEQAGQGIEMTWPRPSWYPWSRGVSDLFVDSQGMLWASGADDMGDSGPFRSYIHVVGKVDPRQEWPIMNYMPYQYTWALDGLKVEAIAAPRLPGSVLSYATDDEGYGGIFRPLPPAAPRAEQFQYYGE